MLNRARLITKHLRPRHISLLTKMPEFKLPSNEAVTVSLPESGVILQDDLLDFPAFKVLFRGVGRVLF
jgi:hypothetical protein